MRKLMLKNFFDIIIVSTFHCETSCKAIVRSLIGWCYIAVCELCAILRTFDKWFIGFLTEIFEKTSRILDISSKKNLFAQYSKMLFLFLQKTSKYLCRFSLHFRQFLNHLLIKLIFVRFLILYYCWQCCGLAFLTEHVWIHK